MKIVNLEKIKKSYVIDEPVVGRPGTRGYAVVSKRADRFSRYFIASFWTKAEAEQFSADFNALLDAGMTESEFRTLVSSHHHVWKRENFARPVLKSVPSKPSSPALTESPVLETATPKQPKRFFLKLRCENNKFSHCDLIVPASYAKKAPFNKFTFTTTPENYMLDLSRIDFDSESVRVGDVLFDKRERVCVAE